MVTEMGNIAYGSIISTVYVFLYRVKMIFASLKSLIIIDDTMAFVISREETL